jgi:hypothetical protein
MPEGVSNIHRTSPLAASGDISRTEGNIGERRVQLGGGERHRHFAGRAAQKLANFFRALGGAPTSLKRAVVNHNEARRARKAERAAIADLAEATRQAGALKGALPPGVSIDPTGAISGGVESTALGVSDFPLYEMRKGLSLSKEIERQFSTSEMVDCDALPAGPGGEKTRVPKRGYTDMGRITTRIGAYDSEAHDEKTQEERSALAVGELSKLLGSESQAAMATALFSQDIARLFVEGYKDESNKPVMLVADLNKTGATSVFRDRNGDRVDIVSEGLGKVAYDLKPRADGLVDVRMSWNASITGTKDEQNQTRSLPGMDGSPLLFKSEMTFTVDLRGDALKVVGEAKMRAEVEGHMAV